MKNLFITLIILLNLVTFINVVNSESNPSPDPTQGQINTLFESIMISSRELQEKVQNNLLDPDKITVVVCGSGSPI